MKDKINSVLLAKPWLELIENDIYDISNRIREIEDGYFIVYNRAGNVFEVHSTLNKGLDTYCFRVPYKELDYRTLQLCRETNIAMHGDRIYKKMKEENASIEAENKRDFKRQLEGAGYETAQNVVLALDKDELHEGYQKTHYIGGIST